MGWRRHPAPQMGFSSISLAFKLMPHSPWYMASARPDLHVPSWLRRITTRPLVLNVVYMLKLETWYYVAHFAGCLVTEDCVHKWLAESRTQQHNGWDSNLWPRYHKFDALLLVGPVFATLHFLFFFCWKLGCQAAIFHVIFSTTVRHVLHKSWEPLQTSWVWESLCWVFSEVLSLPFLKLIACTGCATLLCFHAVSGWHIENFISCRSNVMLSYGWGVSK